MEFLSLSRRRSSTQNVPSGEEQGETDVFAGYSLYFHELNKKLVVNIPQLISQHQEEFIAMLNSPNEPGDAAPRVGAPSAQGRPGQERPEMVLNVTAQEKEAIERVRECVIFVITVLQKSTVQSSGTCSHFCWASNL